MLQIYDDELRRILSAERVEALRASARRAERPRPGPVRVRVGESLVRAGLRLAPEAHASRPHAA